MPLLAGEEIWCQLFSEPGAGSDLANVSTRAVRDGDTYVISGQKIWTSMSQFARFGILLARTDPDAPKRHGISYFIFPMQQPGVEIRPIVEMTGKPSQELTAHADTQASAARARAVIMEVERSLGFEPTDREFEKLGYDIESRVPGTGKLRFLEVKGRVTSADTVTVTKNEILYSLNKPDDFILAIVEFLDDTKHNVHYLRRPFRREPVFGDCAHGQHHRIGRNDLLSVPGFHDHGIVRDLQKFRARLHLHIAESQALQQGPPAGPAHV